MTSSRTPRPDGAGEDAASVPDRLPCGRDTDVLLEQVAAGRADDRDEHQRTCPHCQAALGEFDRLWRPVHEAAAAEVRAPESVLDQALRAIRGVTADPEFGRLPSSRGSTRIASRVVAVLARHVAQQVPGVRIVVSRTIVPEPGTLRRLATDDDGTAGDTTLSAAAGRDGPSVQAGVAGGSTAVQVTLAADHGQDLQALARRVRAAITERVAADTGLHPVSVDVHIDDVFLQT